MELLITNRLLTRVGTVFLKNARDLAKAAYVAKQLTKNQIINGFLLRATGRISESPGQPLEKDKGAYVATVMDFPGYIFFAGDFRIPASSFLGLASAIGTRDDFQAPGSTLSYETKDKSSYFILPTGTREDQSSRLSRTVWSPALQSREWFLGYSIFETPISRSFPDRTQWYLDDETYFDYDSICALTGTITSFFTSARSLTIDGGQIVVGSVALNYFLRNQYSVSENDLPDDWKLYPRRLVPRDQSFGNLGLRRYPGDTMNGFAMIPASASTVLEGTDLYCHAARTFRQSEIIWGFEDTGFFYDRYGEQGLLIAIGEQDRSNYDTDTGALVFASTAELRVLSPANLSLEYLRPSPEVLPAEDNGKPELPNFGTFYTPSPVHCGSGFAVFSAYTTYRDLEDIEDESTYGMVGDLWSILTTLPGGQTISLRADWNAPVGEIPTGVEGEFMQPWIVGAASIVNQQNEATAYCLVWEQTYVRDNTTVIGGTWSLYSTSGSTPVRTLISGGAPLFASLLQAGPYLFTNGNYDVANPKSAVYYAGEGKLVTACSDYPPSTGLKSIKCAIFDVSTDSVRIGGEITISTSQLDKCIITVARPFIAAVAGGEETPAVLLAAVTVMSNAGGGDGKTYISNDGGGSWREYVTDSGGQAGSFYVGNKLWKFDLTKGLDGRS